MTPVPHMEIERLKKELENSQGEVDELRKKNSKLEKELKICKQKMKELECENDALRKIRDSPERMTHF